MSNWEWKKLGDVCTIHGRIGWQGLTKKEHRRSGDYLLITGVNFTSDNTVDYDSCVYVDEERYVQDPNIQVRKNDLLITKDGTLGKLALITDNPPKPATLNGGLFVIRNENNTIYPKFLMNVMKSDAFRKRIEKSITGSTVPHLTQNMLANFPIPIPPLSEQKRIVKILDEKFAKIDNLKTAAETNLKNAKEIFNAELISKLNVENENLPQGWERKTLGEVCLFKNGFAFQSKLFKEDGFPIIRISNVQADGIDYDNMVYFDPLDYKVDFEKYKVFPNDILIAMSGGTTGKIGVNRTKDCFYLNQRVGAFRENEKKLNHWYLYYFLKTKSKESLEISAGSAQPNLSTEQINNFQISLPPLSEQKRIVAHLDNLSEKVKRLEENYTRTIADCEELKRSILKQVFEGDSQSSRE